MKIPTGNVTFLFSDIEGSTKLSQDYPDTLQAALDKHHSIMQKAIESNSGFVFEIVGDAFYSAFEKAEDAVKAAVDAQINLAKEKWQDAVIKIRIGIHTGYAEWSGKSYMGYITIGRAARVMSAAYGEQIIISNDTYELCREKFDAVKEKDVSFHDLGERRLKDVAQPLRLFQIFSPGLRKDFPPLKTLDARPNNIPVQLTNFIGREKEIPEIKSALTKTRLLTLIGPGGTGKTRLALQVAADVIDDFTAGVWIAEFAPLFDPLLIPLTMAKALGIKEQPGQQTESILINFLKEKEILLILDNCEHLINGCAKLAEQLLKNCPKIKIIATSREALRINGEVTHRVLSLAHPEPKQITTPLELSQFEAVRLFIERALSVSQNFRVTNENAPALAQICYQLDGIPLAIELAAARINVISVEKISEKLNDRFKFLTGGRRTSLPRQQTLKALIDWSYDLLSDKEKLLLRRLSIFSGGWTLEAAEEICSDQNIDVYEIMDIHTNLLDKSLINTTEISGVIRFNMLQSIKQYAKERSDTNDALDKKHFHYFWKITDYEQMQLSGMSQQNRTKLIHDELDNIRAALQWSAEHDQDESCTLINNMSEFWNIKGYFIEGLQSCQKIINSKIPVSQKSKAEVLYHAAVLSHGIGNIVDAKIFAAESLTLFRETNHRGGIARALNVSGVLSGLNPEKENEAMEYYNESLSISREMNNRKEIAVTLYNMSFIFHKEGNLEKALEYKLDALKIYKEINDFHSVSLGLASLGVFESKRNNFEIARAYTEESLSNSYLLEDKYLTCVNLVNLGYIYSGLNQFEKAYGLLEESQVIANECGYKSSSSVALMYLGDVSSKLGDDVKAIKFYKEAVKTALDLGIDFYLGDNLYNLGVSYYNVKDFENSLKYFCILRKVTKKYSNPFNPNKMQSADEYQNKIKEIIGIEKYDECIKSASLLSKEDVVQ